MVGIIFQVLFLHFWQTQISIHSVHFWRQGEASGFPFTFYRWHSSINPLKSKAALESEFIKLKVRTRAMALRVKSKFWIEDEKGGPVFGHGRQQILEKIGELGSIRAAAKDLKMSYRAVWGKIKTAEERLGIKLIETFPGGGKNRGARLTPEAKELLLRFRQLHELGNSKADEMFKEIFKT